MLKTGQEYLEGEDTNQYEQTKMYVRTIELKNQYKV